MPKQVKIVVYVDLNHANQIRAALAAAGAGQIGEYDHCSFTVKGKGRYCGSAKSKPTIGQPETLETIEEERIETICPESKVHQVIEALKKAHPYDEPALDIYPLLKDQYL